jgi:hypothetical protein
VIVSISSPGHGTAVISDESLILYSPEPGFTGEDTFTYTIEDRHGQTPHAPGPSSTATVTITVNNKPPVAVDDEYDVPKNSQDNPFNVLVNDSDPDGDPIGISAASAPVFGSNSFNEFVISYSPDPGFCGSDVFNYEITDSKGATDSAQVTVHVMNAPPLARDDSAQTCQNTPVVIKVLANDSDPDGDPIKIDQVLLNANAMGSVKINANGTLTYTPKPDWWGDDSFQYTIIDDCGETSTAMVTIMVTEFD